MRVSELLGLTIGTVRRLPNLAWKGKANKPRTAVAGPALVDAITRYLALYEAHVGRPLADSDPLLCPNRGGPGRAGHAHWGQPIHASNTVCRILDKRAAAAGLAHIAPHDLKRSAARIMHEARGADGGHLFDLLEISDVLDHSNPKVTKDCYIGPLGNASKERAALLFG